MNTGNSVRDADPRFAVNADLSTVDALQESVEALSVETLSMEALQESATLTMADDEAPGDADPIALTRPTFQHVQNIQELIDKLAAVNNQLRHPGHS